jgi:hypothetical protein
VGYVSVKIIEQLRKLWDFWGYFYGNMAIWLFIVNLWLIMVNNIGITIDLGKKFITTSLFSLTGIMVRIRGIIPKWPQDSGL